MDEQNGPLNFRVALGNLSRTTARASAGGLGRAATSGLILVTGGGFGLGTLLTRLQRGHRCESGQCKTDEDFLHNMVSQFSLVPGLIIQLPAAQVKTPLAV